MSLLDGFFSLGQDLNKVQGTETLPETTLLPELTLDMGDDELIALARDWTKNWKQYEPTILKIQTVYCLGLLSARLVKFRSYLNIIYSYSCFLTCVTIFG